MNKYLKSYHKKWCWGIIKKLTGKVMCDTLEHYPEFWSTKYRAQERFNDVYNREEYEIKKFSFCLRSDT